jgi:recombinational DNA repair protein RecT
MGKETAIAVTEQSVGKYVQDTLPSLIKNYAAREYDGNAFLKTAALCIVENADLMACLQTEAGRISLRHALRYACTTGLSLNPQEGKACLVAIDGKVSYWPMKNGLVDLILDTGAVKYVRMNAIHVNDHWKLMETIDGDKYEFSPSRRSRGEIDGFFCAIKLISGESIVEFMPRDEVEEHKKRYGKGLGNPKSAWNTSFEGMGIKTVAKRATKRLALPPEKTKALDAAVAMTDAEPVAFEEAPAAKGASAADVEAKLKAQKAAKQPPQAEQPASSAPATAAPAQPAAGITGAPAKEGELVLTGEKDKLDIF